MKTIKDKEIAVFKDFQTAFGFKNPMQSPRMSKAVISVGVGSFKDKKKVDIVVDRLKKITGQKPVLRGAKKSIASYKTREGDIVGAVVTLRGKRMYGFVDKLLNVALPRTKDFRGISDRTIDEMGNITVGIKEHIIFPEATDEELKDVFGMAVTIATTAKNKKEARLFFEKIGFPFTKETKESKE
jgi:large subunit ribosomal protein L5